MSNESTDDVAPSTGAPASSPPDPGQGQPPVSPMSDEKLVVGIPGIVLGGTGVHKFYLGYQKEGIMLLVALLLGWVPLRLPSLELWKGFLISRKRMRDPIAFTRCLASLGSDRDRKTCLQKKTPAVRPGSFIWGLSDRSQLAPG
jgi:hypothetical protein